MTTQRTAKNNTATLVQEFNPARVRPFPNQPRKRFRGIKELAQSIARMGQIIPGKVTLVHDSKDFDAQLVDGERRLRGCLEAGKPFRAEIHENAGTEEQQFEMSLAANFGKQDHDCIEIAESLGRLQKAGRTIKEMADICGGKSPAWVSQHLSLLKLHPSVQEMMIPGDDETAKPLAFMTAIVLANHPHDFQLRMANKIIKGEMGTAEARRVIIREADHLGLRATKNKNSPQDNYLSLESCIKNITHRLGVFVDMDGKELQAAVDAAGPKLQAWMITSINDLNDDLSEIADIFEKSLAASKRRPKK